MKHILTINPGSTSTKLAFFREREMIQEKKISHSAEEMAGFARVIEQLEFRWALVAEFLEELGARPDAVVGRGGVLKPLAGGVWAVNEAMVSDIREGRVQADHASNLGAVLAFSRVMGEFKEREE